MSMLSQLSPDIQNLVVSLPFRVGYFISASDKTGGGAAAAAEQQALQNIVTFYVEDAVKSQFAHEVMTEMANRKGKWDGWKQSIETTPDDCGKLTTALVGVIDAKEIIAFKQNLLEIAVVVAQAYREINENSSAMEKLRQVVHRMISHLRTLVSGEAVQESAMANISPLERAAIKKLANQLNIDFNF